MIEFDPKYAEALALQADELVKCARVEPAPPRPERPPPTNPIYPVFNVTREHLAGEFKWFSSVKDGEDTEVGRFWLSGDHQIGWDGEAYQKIVRLASKLANGKPLGEFVSMSFALDEVCSWLRTTLEKGQGRTLASHLKARCEETLFEGEMWIPLNRTYANAPFAIGTVTFRAIHKDMMDAWYSHFSAEAQASLTSQRSSLQASLAAVVSVHAEPQKAVEIAWEKATDAAALLRFLSAANWSCKIRSDSVPLGAGKKPICVSLVVKEGVIRQVRSGVTEASPQPWNVTENIRLLPDILGKLHDLALNNTKSELRRSLYDALLIYSKNNLRTDLSEKLLFVLVSLESLLLHDGNEAIQGNLAERLAFLAGATLEERKLIVQTTRTVYGLRSNFVHHGKAVEDVDALERFLTYAWNGLAVVLTEVDKFPSRAELIAFLNDRRLA